MNRTLYLLLGAPACIAIAACSPRTDNQTVGQKVDQVVAGAKAEAQEAQGVAKEASEKVAASAMDATITTKINVALAADDKLKALKIDVDTSDGRVVLNGTAPDPGSRDRATTLARSVEGVVAVDNRLAVESKG